MALSSKILRVSVIAVLLAGFHACGWIDDDLSDCPEPLPAEADCTFDFETRLITNKQIEIDSVLSGTGDRYVKAALEQYTEDIFKDYGKDLNINFFDVAASSTDILSDATRMDATRRSYQFKFAPGAYHLLSGANTAECEGVSLDKPSDFARAAFQQNIGNSAKPDTLAPHKSGLYSARLPFSIEQTLPQSYDVDLYMVNCGTALVVETATAPEIDPAGIRIVVTGFADKFTLKDSVFSYPTVWPIVRTDKLKVEGGTELCFASIHFPTRDPRTDASIKTRSYTETKEPFKSGFTEEPMFDWYCYVRKPDGSITRTVLSVHKPVRAGQLKIVKCFVDPDGHIYTDNTEVGASVQLDWTPGNEYIIEL